MITAPSSATDNLPVTNTIQAVSDQLTAMGLTFDALDNAGMYRLAHAGTESVRWTLETPSCWIWNNRDSEDFNAGSVKQLSANAGATIKFGSEYLIRTQKKEMI